MILEVYLKRSQTFKSLKESGKHTKAFWLTKPSQKWAKAATTPWCINLTQTSWEWYPSRNCTTKAGCTWTTKRYRLSSQGSWGTISTNSYQDSKRTFLKKRKAHSKVRSLPKMVRDLTQESIFQTRPTQKKREDMCPELGTIISKLLSRSTTKWGNLTVSFWTPITKVRPSR